MNVDAFLDTNVLVYAAAGREQEATKRARALDLIDEIDFGLSAQVLQEFYVTVVRKVEAPLSPSEALEWIEQLEAFPCQSLDPSLVKLGVEISQRYRISYWGRRHRRRGGGTGRPHLVHRRPEPRPDLRLRTRREPVHRHDRHSEPAVTTSPWRPSHPQGDPPCPLRPSTG